MIDGLDNYLSKLAKLRSPLGLMLFKAERYFTVPELAARCGAALTDFRVPARESIPEGSRYVDFQPDSLFAAIRRAHDASPSRKLVIQHFDLGLARLKVRARHQFWDAVINNFPANSKTSVVLAMPDEETAAHLLPRPDVLQQWFESTRAIRIPVS